MNLIAAAIIGIAVIVLLIAACKVHPFLSLLAGSFVMAVCAGVLSVVCFCAGLTGSYLWGTPVGATVVLVNLAVFLLTRVISRLRKA